MAEAYEDYLAKIRDKGRISILGATEEEMAVIRSALNLLRTRCEEKNTDHPNMGWGKQARQAQEIKIRLE